MSGELSTHSMMRELARSPSAHSFTRGSSDGSPAPVPIRSRFRRALEAGEGRTYEQVWEHYAAERSLAERLRNSELSDRVTLYRKVYNELFNRVPHHPQLTRKATEDELRVELERQRSFLDRHVKPDDRLLEIGAGDCSLSRQMARLYKHVIAVDVSECISASAQWPNNCEFRQTDGTRLPVESASVDVVYSNQLMEHLNLDDAVAQLREIARVLKASGCYVCVTPNRAAGPWDVSVYFDEAARGLHLREYSVDELKGHLMDNRHSELGRPCCP